MAEAEAAAVVETKTEGVTVMVVGIDDSEHSYYALQWTLLHFFSGRASAASPFKLIVVHAKPSPSSVVSLAGPGAADVLPYVESDLRKIAARVLEKAKELCAANSVGEVLLEVVEGDARNVLCEAVEKHHADMLVVGSHGYGAIKRVVLGSVSDYCAHHAHCTVMIVKKPKPMHKH
nr:universal stress protein PHOS34-like protein [Agave sisalana]